MLISTLHAILLGIIQGLAEFIPISSSGHLVLIPAIFGIRPGGLGFDVAMHIGTMFAVIVYMRRELVAMIGALTGRQRGHDALVYRKLAWFAVAASVPVGIVGVTLKDTFEDIFATPMIAASALLITGMLLLFGEHVRDRRVARARQPAATGAPTGDRSAPSVLPSTAEAGKPAARSARPDEQAGDGLPMARDAGDPTGIDLARMSWREALLVGLAQCFALFPGISRSGTTIVAGMATGLTREAATRFSFLLSLPALVGAIIVSLPDMNDAGSYPPVAVFGGIVAAFGSGYLAIGFLIKLVARERLTGFALYCFAAGLLSLLILTVT